MSDKICRVCGIDCEGIPRVKDRQGRYACQACFEKLKARKAAVEAKPEPVAVVAAPVREPVMEAGDEPAFEDDVFANLGSLAMEEESVDADLAPRWCESCGARLQLGQATCPRCEEFDNDPDSRVATKRDREGKPKRTETEEVSKVMTLIGLGVGLVVAGALAGAWIGVGQATGRPAGWMALLVGFGAAIGTLVAVRGQGSRTIGLAVGAIAAGASVVALFATPSEETETGMAFGGGFAEDGIVSFTVTGSEGYSHTGDVSQSQLLMFAATPYEQMLDYSSIDWLPRDEETGELDRVAVIDFEEQLFESFMEIYFVSETPQEATAGVRLLWPVLAGMAGFGLARTNPREELDGGEA